MIEAFNETHLLEIKGEKYKRAYYPNENFSLQEWLKRKRISFTHGEYINATFYKREILDCTFSAFNSVNEVYFMLKEALAAH